MNGMVISVVGATGAVGGQMLQCLEERNFPIRELRLMAAPEDVGQDVSFRGEKIKVRGYDNDFFRGCEIALFSAGGDASVDLAPKAVKAGCVVVDNSSAFRMDPQVPLVVPEVNPADTFSHCGIIANPNCSTIQMVVVLKPIYDLVGIHRIVVSTYQAVSGTGIDAIDELKSQALAYLRKEPVQAAVYPHQIAFNALPQIDVFLDNFYTKEEMKMVLETKKIMHDAKIKVTATAVRVPVFNSHSESVNIETNLKISRQQAIDVLRRAPGVFVEDDPATDCYPMAINASGRDDIFVGRIREDDTIDNGLNMWIVGDNLRKGAATNAVQIAELLLKGNG
jgi:aspartate-semialdehyde dehydrogenase